MEISESRDVAEVPSMQAPRVTVIIPVYNDLARLRTCLDLLATQTYPRELLDVIVADNASSIDLSSALPPADERFRMIQEAKRGSYAARNAALGLASGDVVAFTDADCLPHSDWIEVAVAALVAPDAPDAVGGAIRLVFRDGPDPVTGPELYESVHGFDQRHFVEGLGFAATANLVTRREMIELVGPFNADLQSGGDDDWGHRLRDAGGRLEYLATAVVDHPSRPTWSDLTIKAIRIADGMAALSREQSFGADLAELARELRSGLGSWLTIWGKDWPTTPGAKARYVAALSWVAVLRLVVRIRYRIRERLHRKSSG